jgi:hypothetical protein
MRPDSRSSTTVRVTEEDSCAQLHSSSLTFPTHRKSSSVKPIDLGFPAAGSLKIHVSANRLSAPQFIAA